MKEIIVNIFCGFAGGILVYLFQYTRERRSAKNKFVDNFKTDNKWLPTDFVYSILPGTSMEKVNHLLGIADYSYEIDEILLFGEGEIIQIREYNFRNCRVRISHSDGQLNSLFINSYPGDKITFIKYDIESDAVNILNEYAVDYSFDENKGIIYELSSRQCWFGIKQYFGRIGNYCSFCYYGSLEPQLANEGLTIELLKGRLIEGFGIAIDEKLFRYYS